MLEDAKFDKISLIFGRIVGSLYLVRSDVSSLDLTGASIQGEFSVGESDEHRPRWAKDAQLVLRNATVGALQSPPSLEAWPALELGGCTYKQLGGLSLATRRKEMAAYLPNWFVNWLKKDRIFSPHPYHQLANVLRSMGHAETADAVLYAGKERERRAAGWRKLKWWGMGLLRLTIGYGYGYKYFRSLLWALGITCIGAIILATTPAGREVSPLHTHTAVENTGILGVLGRYQLASNLAYSFDLLLPIVELDKRHSLEGIFGWQRYYFYLHELLGYVLGSFIVAGLAGLTKK